MSAVKIPERCKAILELLSDGLPHTKSEILSVMDSQADENQLRNSIWALRTELKKIGQDIVARSGGNRRSAMYQHVRLLGSPD